MIFDVYTIYTYIISYHIISMAAVPAFELPKQNGAVVFSGRRREMLKPCFVSVVSCFVGGPT